jgi:multisubunit Na+/H+ antiporter MnhB subunit
VTAWLEQWVIGGGLIDTIITITLLEITALLLYHHQTKRGLKPRDYLLNVVSGLCLMLALRCALTGAAWYFISVWLLAAGLAHVADIALRFQQRESTL